MIASNFPNLFLLVVMWSFPIAWLLVIIFPPKRVLTARWTVESYEMLEPYFGLEVEQELVDALVAEIHKDIDEEIKRCLGFGDEIQPTTYGKAYAHKAPILGCLHSGPVC